MHRTLSSIRRPLLTVALGMLLAVLAGCGSGGFSNPVAPSTVTLKADKNPNHAGGRENNPHSASGSSGTNSGTTSGSFADPGDGEVDEPLVSD